MEPKLRKGARPFSQHLISTGVTDPNELLGQVNAAYPQVKFDLGEAKRQIRKFSAK